MRINTTHTNSDNQCKYIEKCLGTLGCMMVNVGRKNSNRSTENEFGKTVRSLGYRIRQLFFEPAEDLGVYLY
jgi:hypothetical protein